MDVQSQSFRLSPQQKQVWSRWREDPHAWISQCSITLQGGIHQEVLWQALEDVVSRHESLRTELRRPQGMKLPLQVIAERGVIGRREIDASAVDADAAARDLLLEERELLLGLENGPCLRAAFLRLAEERGVLVLTLPTFRVDPRSLANLLSEIGAAYAARTGTGSGPEEEPMQYVQFSEWQNELLEEDGGGHWRKVLADPPPPLHLPGERGAEEGDGGFSPQRFEWRLAPVGRAIEALAENCEASPEEVLFAVWQSLLGRLGERTDLLLAAVFENRAHEALQDVLGLLAKAVPVRCRVQPGASFSELLGEARDALREAAEWKETFNPADWQELTDGRPAGFPVGFEVRERPAPVVAGPLELSLTSGWALVEHCKLQLVCVRDREGWLAELIYDPRVFSAAEIERLAGRFDTLLGSVFAEPGTAVEELEILPPAELAEILSALAPPQAALPAGLCVHRRFEEQARRAPDGVAIEAGGLRLSYRELEARANQLSHHLRRLGVGPESRVALLIERSPEMVVAVLAVLKAGGAYVPLEPGSPRERLALTLEDSRPAVVLTHRRLAGALPGAGWKLVHIDADREEIAAQSEAPPPPLGAPENLAYVLYTSGSTGRPKGVLVPHGALMSYLIWCVEAYAVAEGKGALVHTSLGFDLTVTSLLAPLLAGRTVVLLPEGAGVGELAAALRAHPGLSLLKLTPAHLELLERTLGEEGLEDAPAKLILGGEALHWESLGWWRRHAPRTVLVNEYGPTETVVGCCIHTTAVGGAAASGPVPIGRPIANTRLCVLDPWGRPVPFGVAGELFIGGAGVTRGYLDRPDLTAERFVPDPWSGESGERLYRTGDHVRLRQDGILEFLGRRDQQVKIRGYRVELGEIESALLRHPAISEAVVTVLERPGQDRELAAYFVSREEIEVPALRGFLSALLFEALIPHHFVRLRELPLTPNGKVDRRGLPAPDLLANAGSGRVAPRTPFEARLAAIWGELLGRPEIGVSDGFFDIGGDSIKAVRLVSRLNDELGAGLTLEDIFRHQSVEALAHRLGGGSARQPLPPLRPVSRDGVLPVSFAQQRLLFLQQMEPESPAYNLPGAFRIFGPLDVTALARTVSEIVRRHEILRTTFPGPDAGQVIHPVAPVEVQVLDLSALPGPEREEQAREEVARMARQPFDLAHGPLLRLRLLWLGPGEWVFSFCMHHIVSDGWSTGVLVRELGRLYGAFSRGQEPDLPDLPVQYADYAAHQRSWFSGEVFEEQLEYWRNRLAGAPEVLELPLDRPRPALRSGRGALLVRTLPPPLVASLRRLSRGSGATLFMTLATVFKILLQRYGNGDDLVVGTTATNRNRREVEDLIGFFVNLLVLRSDLSGNPTFREALERVREAALGALAHQELPFERLVEEIQPQRNPSVAPLCQAVFELHQVDEVPALALEGLTVAPFPFAPGTAKLDVILSARDGGDGLRLDLQYATDVIDGATAERMLTHFELLLTAVAEGADRPIEAFALPAELELGRGPARMEAPLTLDQRFAEQAARHPDRVALVAQGGGQLTYAELDTRSNRLARRLRRLGVGADERVALCLERSPEMIIGILGVLKAGGAYVPIDPSNPAERKAAILESVGARVLLTEERCLASLPSAVPGAVLCQDRDAREIAAESPEPVEREGDPDSLAYVIYTSGSTGRPKGAMVSHLAISNRTLWTLRRFPMSPQDVLLQKTPYTFDASIWEIFAPLFAGACLVLAEPGGHQDPARLLAAIAEHQVTVLQLVPSMLAVFLDQPTVAEEGRSLRRVFCGGEALPGELAERFFARLDCELCNTYGPTEAAIDVTFQVCSPELHGEAVPIGRPIDNLRLYLRDRQGRLAPRGVPGELLIGGVNLARGYFGEPGQTAERFIPDPWSDLPGERLYRTGDLARLANDGAFEFLGRIDSQVKIRGFRIEPGEIEAVLLRHPAVREAAVTVHDDPLGGKGLTAYAVPQAGQEVSGAGLREHLAERLPEHMVPRAFVLLPELPRLSSGKVDRKALPAPEPGVPGPGLGPVRSRSLTEELLAGIWSSALGIEGIGAEDNFFALGGHSLVALRLISQVREVFNVRLSLRAFFAAPTIAALAAQVESALKSASDLQSPGIVPVPRDRSLPLSFAQQRLWFLQQLEPESSAYNLPDAMYLDGRLDVPTLEAAIGEIVRRHEILRTSFPAIEGEGVQVIHPPAPVTIPIVDLTGHPAGERQRLARQLITEEARRPFDLESRPPVRLLLLRLTGTRHLLFINLHHIVSDGWSVGILVRELVELYGAGLRAETPDLPRLGVQYADYAVWQREWLQGATLEAHLAYWKQQLAGAPEIISLPTDRPHPPVPSYRGGTRSLWLPVPLAERLRELSRGSAATLFMVLLTSFKTLLYRYGAGRDIVVGTNSANRDQKGIENLIGFFVNGLVLRTRFEGGPSFLQALERVRETTLGAFVHQELPFDRVVEELRPRRDLSVSPLYQVVFEMTQADAMPALGLPGVTVSPLALPTTTAKFDLTVTGIDWGDRLSLSAEFSHDLLEDTTVDRMLAHLENLLATAAADPDRPIADLPLLGPGEVLELLAISRGPVRDYPVDRTLGQLFAEQAARTRERTAAVCGGARVTYGELDDQTDRLAGALRSLGVRPGEFVGILAERGLGFLGGMLAILKVGAAYVPFEPGYPEDRLRYMLGDSGISTLLVTAGTAGLLGPGAGGRNLVFLDAPAEAGAADGAIAGGSLLPAYMLYTSGSTGLPKGAVIRHDGAVNHIFAQFEALGLGSELCFLQSAPASSDISVWQFLAPLLVGGRTVIVDTETVSDPGRLFRVLKEEGVTLAELVPAVLRALLDHVAGLDPGERELPALRWMMATGEAVPVDLVTSWLSVYPQIPVVNAYGPTEASDDVTQEILTEIPEEGCHSLSIGRPLANFTCYVLDSEGHLAPVGIPGELAIAGIGVGNGYWRNPARTAESFAPDPYAGQPGAVLYRTGDLVRWLPGGHLQFMGRLDHQVKLRGFRIELGEIEAALDAHPAVRESVVAVREGDGGRRLVAYVVEAVPGAMDVAEVRESLKGRLPSHMQPSALVLLPALPLTPAGKVDRQALPEPEPSGHAEEWLAPGTPLEADLVRIWEEVLRRERVGVRSDFFALGGHSLLATQVLARVRAAHGVEIPLRKVFEHPTIAGFAAVLEAALQASREARQPAIERKARQARRVVQSREGIIESAVER